MKAVLAYSSLFLEKLWEERSLLCLGFRLRRVGAAGARLFEHAENAEARQGARDARRAFCEGLTAFSYFSGLKLKKTNNELWNSYTEWAARRVVGHVGLSIERALVGFGECAARFLVVKSIEKKPPKYRSKTVQRDVRAFQNETSLEL